MNQSTQILRVNLEGRWQVREFGLFLFAVSDLYNLRLLLEVMREEQEKLERDYREFWDWPPLPTRLKRGLFIKPLPSFDFTYSELYQIHRYITDDEQLKIRRLEYASPGSSDLVGIGAIVGHVKDFTQRLIERRDAKRQREASVAKTEAETRRIEAETEGIRIDNARKFLELERDRFLTEMQKRTLMNYVDEKGQLLDGLVDEGKITGVVIVDDE